MTKLFEVTTDEFDSDGMAKCDHCRYRVQHRFLMASSAEEVQAMLDGDIEHDDAYNGFCGTCIATILATNTSFMGENTEYQITRSERTAES